MNVEENSFPRRLNKLADTILNYRRQREKYATTQGILSNCLALTEAFSSIATVILFWFPDFGGRFGMAIVCSVLLLLSSLVIHIFHIRERSFSNKIAGVALRRLERHLDRLKEAFRSGKIKQETLEWTFMQFCQEYDRIEFSNNVNSQFYQPHEFPLPWALPTPSAPPWMGEETMPSPTAPAPEPQV